MLSRPAECPWSGGGRRAASSGNRQSVGSARVMKEKGPGLWPGPFKLPGSDLLSHAVTRAVPSAPRGLTAVFGMGTGGAPSIWPPETRFRFRQNRVILACELDSSRLKNFMAKPHGRLVPVSFAPRSASTPGLSTWSSPTVLQGACAPGKSDLGVGFTLICLQRLSYRTPLPGVCRWRDNRCTGGSSNPVLSY